MTADVVVVPSASSSSSVRVNEIDDNDGPKCYQRQDLRALSLVDDPIWVFDSVRKSMWYANDAAVRLWSANSLADLLARDFRRDMSDATATRLDDYLLKFSSDDSAIVSFSYRSVQLSFGSAIVQFSSLLYVSFDYGLGWRWWWFDDDCVYCDSPYYFLMIHANIIICL